MEISLTDCKNFLLVSTQSHTKSFRYAGGCLVHCPRSKESGVLTGGGGVLTSRLLRSTGGVTGLLVTGVSSFRSSLISPDGAPPPPSPCSRYDYLILWPVLLPSTHCCLPPGLQQQGGGLLLPHPG